jgi:hypothetical protein
MAENGESSYQLKIMAISVIRRESLRKSQHRLAYQPRKLVARPATANGAQYNIISGWHGWWRGNGLAASISAVASWRMVMKYRRGANGENKLAWR